MMWTRLCLLPLVLVAETFAAINDHLETPEYLFPNKSCDIDGSGRPEDLLTTTLWWQSFGGFLARNLPGDPSRVEPGFLNDLRIALNISIPPTPTTQHDSYERRQLSKREQKVLKTKCRVRPIHRHQDWDDSTPNYTPTDSLGHPLPTQTMGDGHGGGGSEVIAVTAMCGNIPPGATVNTTSSTGPNGQFSWLTCGIDPKNNSTGWQPPQASVDQIITYPGGLRAAVQAENSPYKPCTRFVNLFETAGAEFRVPPMYIAAFALQESGCNPDIDGAGGEQGMMQISPEKCANAPDGDCKDVVYNVRTAVSFFADVLKSVNGNAFEAVGSYNGWFRGMSYAEATTWGINGDCCRCQRNLSYLSQFFNGWLQNMDAWNPWLGTIHNTDIC
ncbi:hypothetical protein FRC19_010597 [Serendipita sp. 401]|nr:hypothetical protein FRC19_010597 [Serendipita sp. 401]